MMTAAVAPTVLPPVPLLGAAVLVLVVLVGSMVVLRRRGRTAEVMPEAASTDDDDASLPSEAAEVPAERPDAATGDDAPLLPVADPGDEGLSPNDDPRALRLLVRTLEAAIEELSSDLDRVTHDRAALASTAEPKAPEDPVATPRKPDDTAERRLRMISQAVQEAGGGDLAARLNAALLRRGAPRAFARPDLAACIDEELPVVRRGARAPGPAVSVSVSEAGTPDGPPQGTGPASGDDVPAPADDVPASEPQDAPAEPDRVLPVPAPSVPVAAPRRGLFRRPVA